MDVLSKLFVLTIGLLNIYMAINIHVKFRSFLTILWVICSVVGCLFSFLSIIAAFI
jgi:hypothetical protein